MAAAPILVCCSETCHQSDGRRFSPQPARSRPALGADDTRAVRTSSPRSEASMGTVPLVSRSASTVADELRMPLRSLASSVATELCHDMERELQLSQRETRCPCSGSASLVMLWSQFSHASDDAVFRSIANEVSLESGHGGNGAGPALHFVADIKRSSRSHRYGFGCTEVSSDSGEVLLVSGIERGGCVDAWNDSCAQTSMPWRRIHPCTAVLSVNGIAGGCSRMRHELAVSTQAVLLVCSPPTLSAAIGVLRVIRAAAPLPAGTPFWVNDAARLSPATVVRPQVVSPKVNSADLETLATQEARSAHKCAVVVDRTTEEELEDEDEPSVPAGSLPQQPHATSDDTIRLDGQHLHEPEPEWHAIAVTRQADRGGEKSLRSQTSCNATV